MTTQQILAFGVIGLMMAVFIWDRFRYDLVACGALMLAVAVGLVPQATRPFRVSATTSSSSSAVRWLSAPASPAPASSIPRSSASFP
jgi:di/tricarboxylate transporter